MSDKKSNSKLKITAAFGLFIALVVGAGYIYDQSTTETEQQQAVIEGENGPKIQAQVVPGQSDDPNYNKLVEEENKKKLDEAKSSGDSFIPTIKREEDENKKDQFDNIQKSDLVLPEPEPEPEPTPEPVDENPLQVQEEVQPEPEPEPIPVVEPTINYVPDLPKQPVVEVDPNDVAFYEAGMAEVIEKVRGEFYPTNQTSSEFSYTGVKKEKNETATSTGSSNSNVSSATTSTEKKNVEATLVRTGTIIPAQMLTAVNTDEPGPILAEIVSGPLKGARVLGQITHAPTEIGNRVQKVTIQFTKLMKVGADGSYSISAYAVDPETSRTAVADRVDNRYFERYVGGLAAAFLQGVGEAFGKSNNTVIYGENTTSVVSVNDTKNALRTGLGNVGVKLGQEIEKTTTGPATIYVDSGTTIGLLFVEDF